MIRWHTLSLARPAGHLRDLARGVDGDGRALLSQREAGVLLGLPPTPGTISTVSQAELRGTRIQLRTLLTRAAAYAPPGHRAEVEIRVRWVPEP